MESHTDRNIEIMSDYILTYEFLLHNQMFIPSKDKYKGFNRYLQNESYPSIFQSLYEIVEREFRNRELLSSDNQLFTKESVDIHTKYRYIKAIHRMIVYVNNLSAENDINTDNDELLSLISSFIVDICIHTVQEWTDPIWIYTSQQELNQLLSSKKEKKTSSIKSIRVANG